MLLRRDRVGISLCDEAPPSALLLHPTSVLSGSRLRGGVRGGGPGPDESLPAPRPPVPGSCEKRADRGEEPHKTLADAQQPASGGEAELTCRPAAGSAKPATSPSFPVVGLQLLKASVEVFVSSCRCPPLFAFIKKQVLRYADWEWSQRAPPP
ncbi:unnamed protein product [Gadus morhua 'NCC']